MTFSSLITLIYHKKCSGEASGRVLVIISIRLKHSFVFAIINGTTWQLIMMTFSNSLADLKVFWKKSWLIIFVIDSLIHVFVWKKYPDRGSEGQKIVHRRVLGNTPPEPTLHFKMIVEDTRPIVYLSQVQFLHDKLLF